MKNKSYIKCFIILVFAIFTILPCHSANIDFGKGFISDEANFVYNKDIVNEILLNLHNDTKADLVVVTLNSKGNQSFKDIEKEVLKKYQIGGERKDRYAMLIITRNPYQMKIRVGSALNHAIPSTMRRAMAGEFWLHKQFNTSDIGMARNSYTMTLLLAEAIADEYNIRLYSNQVQQRYMGYYAGYVRTQQRTPVARTNGLDKFLRRYNLFVSFYLLLFGVVVPLMIRYGGSTRNYNNDFNVRWY